jgi:hypothetical protein
MGMGVLGKTELERRRNGMQRYRGTREEMLIIWCDWKPGRDKARRYVCPWGQTRFHRAVHVRLRRVPLAFHLLWSLKPSGWCKESAPPWCLLGDTGPGDGEAAVTERLALRQSWRQSEGVKGRGEVQCTVGILPSRSPCLTFSCRR